MFFVVERFRRALSAQGKGGRLRWWWLFPVEKGTHPAPEVRPGVVPQDPPSITGGRIGINSSERRWQILDGATEDADVLRRAKIRYECGLSGLLFEIPTEMCPSESASQSLLLVREEVFDDVVGTVDDGDDSALVVASDGMTEQLCPIQPKIAQDDARR